MVFSEEELAHWWKLEAEGRRMASERDEIARKDDWFLKALGNAARKIRELFTALDLKDWADMSDRISRIARALGGYVFLVCSDEPRKNCRIPAHIEDDFAELDEYSKKATGKRCTWLRGEVEEYTLPAALNDLTACFHRVLEKVSEYTQRIACEGRCCWLEDNANPKLVEACREWEKTVQYFYDLGLYSWNDYQELSWLTRGNKAEVRVGSAPGHRTHIDLDKGIVEYYDKDDDVCWVMWRLFEDVAGLECWDFDDGVACKNLTENNLGKAAKVLAAATSMDYRLEDPSRYWPKSELEDVPAKSLLEEGDVLERFLLDRLFRKLQQ